MRPASVAWERAAEVRGAAAGWRRAGAIDDATAARIGLAYPDPCVTPPLVWRALTAVVVSAVLLCLFGAVALALGLRRSEAVETLLIVFAGAAGAATELLEASPRWARRGAAGATALWAVALLLAGVGLHLGDRLRLDDALDGFFGAAAVAFGGACWRWGHPLFAGLSAAALFALLARFPPGRALWIAAGAALIALAARRLDHAPWAPSHRRAAVVLLLAGIAAVYAAVNVYSVDERLLEELRRKGVSDPAAPAPELLLVAALGTLLVPVAVLWWGLSTRRTPLVDAGIVLAALSLVTLRHYVHLAPPWTVLLAAGAGLVALATALERALGRAPDREIAGFTAEPLFADDRRAAALEVVPVVATLTPAAPSPTAPDEGLGQGGKFGGGGTTERF